MFKRSIYRQFAGAARHLSTRVNPVKSMRLSTRVLAGTAGVALGLSAISFHNADINLDVPKNEVLSPDVSVSVDNSIDPFPLSLKNKEHANLHTDFTLLGSGVRTVTFLGIRVYGIGLYVANDDVPKVKDFIKSSGSPDITAALKDPELSTDFVGKLLDANVRFSVRICPVRNTDFTHLKDGLIKSILSHSFSKPGSAVREQVHEGLEQLRDVFKGHKGSVPKNHVLWIEILQNGNTSISYEDTKNNTLKTLGEVEQKMMGKVLFLQYLSGAKPLSEPLRKSCVDGFASL